MNDTVVISIDYDEGDQSTYRGVVAFFGERRLEFRDHLDPVKDFARAIQEVSNIKGVEYIMLSSSCDHFVMDGNQYRFNDHEMIEKR